MEPALHHNPHDRLVKAVFGRKEGARALLAATLPPDLLEQIDLDTVRVVKGNVLTKDLRERFADLLFECHTRGGPILFHFLLEHRSGSRRFTVLDLFVSTAAVWDDWRRRNPRATHVPRIIPMVLHHGEKPWSAPTELGPLFAGDLTHTRFAALEPSFPVLFIDLNVCGDSCFEEAGVRDPLAGATLWALRYARFPDIVARFATGGHFFKRVLDGADGLRELRVVLHYVILVTRRNVDPHDLEQAMAEHIGEQAEEAVRTLGEELIYKGWKKGQAEGKAEAVLLFLAARLGPVPPDLVVVIRSRSSVVELDRLITLATTALSFDEVRAVLA